MDVVRSNAYVRAACIIFKPSLKVYTGLRKVFLPSYRCGKLPLSTPSNVPFHFGSVPQIKLHIEIQY